MSLLLEIYFSSLMAVIGSISIFRLKKEKKEERFWHCPNKKFLPLLELRGLGWLFLKLNGSRSSVECLRGQVPLCNKYSPRRFVKRSQLEVYNIYVEKNTLKKLIVAKYCSIQKFYFCY